MDARLLRPGFHFRRIAERIPHRPFCPRKADPTLERGIKSPCMGKIIIAVGSIRRPKLNAVREALNLLSPSLGNNAQFEIVGVEVPSGVSHTPLTREALMMGERQRAEALVRIAREKNEPWKYFAGLER